MLWLTPPRYSSVATRTQHLVPIETMPIGAWGPTDTVDPCNHMQLNTIPAQLQAYASASNTDTISATLGNTIDL
jgi:hypothetical protein